MANDFQLNQVPATPIAKLTGLIPTVTAAPTYTPRKFSEQFVLYASGATYRLYIYDSLNHAWRYSALT